MKTNGLQYKLFILFLFLVSCSSITIALEKSEYGNLSNQVDDGTVHLTMNVLEQMETGLKLELVNDGETEISYGEYYHLERYQEDDWYVVPFQDDMAFVEIGYLIESGGVNQLSIPLDQFAIDLDEGTYRVIKEFWYDGDGYILAAPFEVIND